MSKYLAPIKRLAGSALVAFIIALVFPALRDNLLSEETRNGVLMQAVPFFAAFVGIILLFAMLIFLLAIRFNGIIPYRAYRPIELLTIIGIVAGVTFLFQPLHFVGYKYGFVLLLASTLGFIAWSHVISRGPKQDSNLPRISTSQHGIGLAAGVVVLIILTYSAVSVNVPQAPYGIRQRLWDSYTPERQQEISSQVTSDFYNVELPFLFVFNLFPAAVVYFIVREIAGAFVGDKSNIQKHNLPAIQHT